MYPGAASTSAHTDRICLMRKEYEAGARALYEHEILSKVSF